jgi:hypothetical protein
MVYSQDVVLKEFGRKSNSKVDQIENNPENVRFELRNEEEDGSGDLTDSNE